jgi:hypothetical protein
MSVAWAICRGRQDREAGWACRTCKAFRARYKLTDTVLTKRMWQEYRSANVVAFGPRESSERAPSGIPREWYSIAVGALGAKAELRDDASEAVVLLKVAGNVTAQYLESRGSETASLDVARFNKEVAERKLRPSEVIVDAWR